MKTCLVVLLTSLFSIALPLHAEVITQGDSVSNRAQSQSAEAASKNLIPENKADAGATVSAKPSHLAISNTMTSLPTVILTLLGLIALIFALAWLAKRFGGLSMIKNRDMQVLSSISLGARERATLIEVNGVKLLLGVTTQAVTRLHTFDTNDESKEACDDDASNQASMQPSDVSAPIESDFSNKLQSLLREGRAHQSKDHKAGRSDV